MPPVSAKHTLKILLKDEYRHVLNDVYWYVISSLHYLFVKENFRYTLHEEECRSQEVQVSVKPELMATFIKQHTGLSNNFCSA